MVTLSDFTQQGIYRWKLDKQKVNAMTVDAELFASRKMLAASIEDGSIRQVINVATLPEIVSPSIAMPDIHYGYGFCIGGVAAFDAETGIVSPGGVGYDINCGVRLLSTNIPVDDFLPLGEAVGYRVLKEIPTGLKPRAGKTLNRKEFFRLLRGGASGAIDRFGGDKGVLNFIESKGCLPFDEESTLSSRAVERGRQQLGSLGAGNHFIEIQRVDEIFDEEAARQFGLSLNTVSMMIHTGSRGFGHQIASDYIELFRKHIRRDSRLVDPQLVHADIKSSPGRRYLQALSAASNFAWANRQILMEQLIGIIERALNSSRERLGFRLVYDQAHNIAKFEDHTLSGEGRRTLVHRKGATRAFPPGHPDLPGEYRNTGQPVILPGSMGTASFVLRGTETAMELSLGSSAHGAGRVMSRHKAIKTASSMDVRQRLGEKGIRVFSYSSRGLKEEIPEAYKSIENVVDVTEGCGISRRVARLSPLVVVKG